MSDAQAHHVHPAGDALDERALEVLDFEREWAARAGDKDAAIRVQFGFGSARYYQVLYALIDSPSALRHDPLLVRRLQRLRDTRTRSRLARTLGPTPMTPSQDRDD
jgi:hypothetical protein